MKKNNILKNFAPIVLTALTVATAMITPAWAGTGLSAITDAFDAAGDELFNIIVGAVGTVGFVVLGWSVIKYMAGDARAAEEAKRHALRTIGGAAAVFFVKLAIEAVTEWAAAFGMV